MAPLSREDVRAILTAFEGVYGHGRAASANTALLVGLGDLAPCPPDSKPEEKSKPKRVLSPQVEERIRQDYTRFYNSENAGTLDGAGPVEDSRFFLALKRSPKYMGAGARQAAEEMFASPVFIASMAISMSLYMIALAALGACKIEADCRKRLEDELDAIAADVCKPGSKLNKLATRKK